MKFTMENLERLTLAQMEEFIEGNREVELRMEARAAAHGFIETVLRTQRYRRFIKGQRGIVRCFLAKVTGLSRAQLTRLLGRWRRTRRVGGPPRYRPCFRARYTAADVSLLAAVDAAHEDLSGPAVRRILQREFQIFGKSEYQRLAGISVSHLYNLRHSVRYQNQRVVVHHTQARQISIGERRKPDPRGRPGYLRVDTVHQGDLDGVKGLYHINAVDEVTQWQVVGATAQISEAWLIPVLEAMLAQFPFRIRGFHSDNGSEFINYRVAELLNKLLVEQTKSRPRHSNDNGLVEAKNGAVIRKHMGYGHIAAAHATAIAEFYERDFNPYLNFHRPCGVPEIQITAKGKQKRIYR